ncbi:MAG: chemotaxis protein CheD [Spirochaetaceae bacterium]
MNKKFYRKSNIKTIYSGEYYVTKKNEIISTVLGSCISVCLYDKVNNICGINHFMLPKNSIINFIEKQYEFKSEFLSSNSLRYGINSMEILINKILAMGGEKKYITAKVFGGGNVIIHDQNKKTIGEQNIDFILGFLKAENIEILNKNIGGCIGRKLLYNTKNNSVYIKKIPIMNIEKIEANPINIEAAGSITIF